MGNTVVGAYVLSRGAASAGHLGPIMSTVYTVGY